jgi:hypothetical protein
MATKRVYRVRVGTLLGSGIVGDKLVRASSQAVAVRTVLDKTVGVEVEVADTETALRLYEAGERVLESGDEQESVTTAEAA